MRLNFRLLIPEEDICDRCIFLIQEENSNDPYGTMPYIRCVNADRAHAVKNDKAYWDKNNMCNFYSPLGGIIKL